LIDGVIMTNDWFDLDGAKEIMFFDSAVIDVEGDDGLVGRYVALACHW